MEERFEKRAEAGGEEGHDKSDKRSWRERFFERMQRDKSESSTEEPAEKRMSVVSFVRDIFRRDDEQGERPNSFIDQIVDGVEEQRSDEDKLAELSEQERTEFYMVVAQRFKDAGERFLRFVRGEETPQPEFAAAAAEVTMDAPEIREVQAMYQEQSDEEPQQPEEIAPPFDFAVTQREEPRLHQENDYHEQPLVHPAQERGSIDDFDFPTATADERHMPVITHDGDVTNVHYRPRMRDVLFAGAVGHAVGRPELRRAKDELERKRKKGERQQRETFQAHEQAAQREHTKLRDEQIRIRDNVQKLKTQQAEVEARHEELNRREEAFERAARAEAPTTQSANDVVETVTRAAKELFEPLAAEPQNADAAKQAAREAAASVEELEFSKLKPAKKDESGAADFEYGDTPDGVSVRSIPTEKLKAPRVDAAGMVVENPFEQKLREHQQGAVTEQRPSVNIEHEDVWTQPLREEAVSSRVTSPEKQPAAATTASSSFSSDPQSVQEILTNRTRIPGEPRSIKRQIANQYDMSTRSGAQNWVSTAVILALILIGLLFISAI